MNFNIIAAIDEKNGIGKSNKIPWYFPEDLKYFSNITKGNGNNAVIMGRNTYESIGNYPLPGRVNIVISSQYKPSHGYSLYWVTSPEEANNLCKELTFNEVWVIGGASIYEYYLNHTQIINKIYITSICKCFNCDTFFPSSYLKKYETSHIINKITTNNTDLLFIVYHSS